MKKRTALGIGLVVAILAAFPMAGAWADTVEVDGDSAAAATENFSITGTCPTTNTVKAGTLKIIRAETPTDATKHWKADTALTLTVSVTDASSNPVSTITSGLNDSDALATPAGTGWDANGDQYSWTTSSTVQPSTPNGTYTVTYQLAGNNLQTPTPGTHTRSDSFTITVGCTSPVTDSTPPTISCTPSASDGVWHATNQSVTCTASDTSGLSASTPSPQTLSTSVAGGSDDANASTDTYQFCDTVGNCATAGAITGWKIDRKNPTSSPSGFTDGQIFVLGVDTLPTVGCTSTDGTGSGIKTGAVPTSSGGPVGTISVTCNGAVDNVDNAQTVASAASSYSVRYNFGGFLEPVNSLPIRNTVKAGRAIPVKFSLGGDYGLSIFAAPGSPTSGNLTCTPAGTDAIEETLTAGNSSLQYDAGTGIYTYVWKTQSSWAGACRTFYLNLNDGSAYKVEFVFNK
jgi:hypothetical protein